MTQRRLGTQLAETANGVASAGSQLLPAIVTAIPYAGTVTVNLAGSIITIPAVGQMPNPGDTVYTLNVNGLVLCLGAVVKPQFGTVTAAAANNRVSIMGADGATYSVNYNHTYTPAVNDTVFLDWSVPGGFVVGPMSVAPTADASVQQSSGATVANTAPTSHTQTFNPTDSGTYESNWFDTRVWCSASTIGCFFYGNQIASTIPSSATITSVSLYLDEQADYYPSSLATIGLHTLQSKSGAPSITSAQTIPNGSGWKGLPTAFGDALKGGGSAFGVGTDHGGEHIYSARGSNNSGALSITWSA